MKRKFKLTLFPILFCLLSFGASAQQPKHASIVVIDFVKSKPGSYAETMKYYEAGWLKARIEAKRLKYIASYKLLTLGENSEGEFDLMLVTEYANKLSYDAAEANFKKVLARVSPIPVRINGKAGNDLRTVVFTRVMTAPPFKKK